MATKHALATPARPALVGSTQLHTNLTLALHSLPELAGQLREMLEYTRRLEAAVRFYAAPPTWGDDGVARHPSTLTEDKGETARMALLRHVNLFVAAIMPCIAQWAA